ncbi:lycopene cyclase family protein [Prauserella oleivorans]|uniref:Lycopene cyclase family protein n=1 Tax=Prauserella oleivorans TaxID=1478153 RepID=A0ABW5W416_9PSEU
MAQVVVLGGGPAGRALAAACARERLGTVLVDPDPGRPWQPTYALWRDEVPDLPADAVAASPAVTLACGTTLDREYVVLDNAGLRRLLTDDRVDVVAGHATDVAHGPHGALVRLGDGRALDAEVVVDARGATPGGTEQTAYGVVLAAGTAAALVPAGGAVFMDWRRATPRDPSFLYAVPLGGDRVLVEETSLARRPGLALPVLAERLHSRLAAAGIDAAGAPVERVRIRLDVPLPAPGLTVAFGTRAALTHPATGFSVATSLRLAPRVAAALADGLRHSPRRAVLLARRAVWSPRALAVHAFRRYALRALTRIPGGEVPAFFELFFAQPADKQRAFTSGREDIAGTTGAMAALFASAPWRLRAGLVG